MMLHFPSGTARMGIFYSTICKLISSKKFKHYEHSNVARNSFSFTRPHGLGVVCLQYSNDSFFQVTFHFPSDPEVYKALPSTSVAVRDTIKKVINGVTDTLHYVPDEPVIAFECVAKHTIRYSLHTTEYIWGEGGYLICTREPSIPRKVTDDHRLWQGVCMCPCMHACARVCTCRRCDQ